MSRVSREQARLNRERVVEVASTLYREHGLNGIGVADIMAKAGLTHGGFYNQFASKEELAGEACTKAFENNAFSHPPDAGEHEPKSLADLVAIYLAERHITHPGGGCPLPALASDVARERRGSPLRQSFTAGLRRMTQLVADTMPARTGERRRQQALATIASLVGAVTLARAMEDEGLKADVLDAVRLQVSALRTD